MGSGPRVPRSARLFAGTDRGHGSGWTRCRRLAQGDPGKLRHVAGHRPWKAQGQGVPDRPYRTFQRSDADGDAVGCRDGPGSCKGTASQRWRARRHGCPETTRRGVDAEIKGCRRLNCFNAAQQRQEQKERTMNAPIPATEDLIYVVEDGIARLTFNRPQARNALTFAMYEQMAAICETVNADRSIKAMILTGTGAGIAACCDIRIGTAAARIGFPIARTLGNCLSMSNISRLVSLIGPARTKDLIFKARLVEAPEALALGLLNEVVPDVETLQRRANETAQLVAGHAPITLEVTKEAVRRIRRTLSRDEGEDLILRAYMSEDFREGMDAFLNKRTPNWKGK